MKNESKSLQEILASVEDTVAQKASVARIKGVVKSLLERLSKFEIAIDVLASSSPHVFGLSLIGLIWGSLKIFLVVSDPSSSIGAVFSMMMVRLHATLTIPLPL